MASSRPRRTSWHGPRETTRTRAPWSCALLPARGGRGHPRARTRRSVLAAVVAHRELAGYRPQGTANVRVTTADEGDNGLLAHSVVEVVCDDMPFLVDSVTAELSRNGRAIHLVIHPLLVVRRDVDRPTARGVPTATAAEVRRRTPSSSPGCRSRSTG